MRTTISSALTGLGAFLLLAAGLVHFYAYPHLATTPTNYDTTTRLEAHDATILDTTALKPVTTDLAFSVHTVADSGARHPKGVVVWTGTTTITRQDTGAVFQQTTERIPFDAKSGAAVNCPSCTNPGTPGVPGQFQDVSGPGGIGTKRIERVFTGQALKFPFDTQKKDYQQWDDSLGASSTAKYVGTAKVDGETTYKFVQTIPTTTLQQESVPGSLFGAGAANVTADLDYSNVKTYWIEPVTGTPVNISQDMKQDLVYDGTSVPALDGTIAYTPTQVQTLVNDTKGKAPMLKGMDVTFPVVLGILGLASLAGGILVRRRRGDAGAPAATDDRTLVHA